MEEQIKILENDIKELIEMTITERENRKIINEITSGCDEIVMSRKETDEEKDYNNYKKLIDTILSNFKIYRRLIQYNRKQLSELYSYFENWINEEIKIIHELMIKSKNNKDNYGQYRCLNYIYTKLLDELNTINMDKPRKRDEIK
jgi:hypothetical protein